MMYRNRMRQYARDCNIFFNAHTLASERGEIEKTIQYHAIHYNIFWGQAITKSANNSCNVNNKMLRTQKSKIMNVWSTITHFTLKCDEAEGGFDCCYYLLLYEKFIKLGKLRDGNLCVLNLYYMNAYTSRNGLNLAIPCEPRSHFCCVVPLIEQWKENKQMLTFYDGRYEIIMIIGLGREESERTRNHFICTCT